MTRSVGAGLSLMARALVVGAIGLASGVGFLLPILAMVLVAPGTARTASLLAAAFLGVVLIRLLGRRLHRLLDATERSHRFPLLALYAVLAMVAPVSFLLRAPAGH